MKFLIAAFTVLFMSGTSLADNNASRFRIHSGRIILAQSYCEICFDNAQGVPSYL